MICAFDPALG